MRQGIAGPRSLGGWVGTGQRSAASWTATALFAAAGASTALRMPSPRRMLGRGVRSRQARSGVRSRWRVDIRGPALGLHAGGGTHTAGGGANVGLNPRRAVHGGELGADAAKQEQNRLGGHAVCLFSEPAALAQLPRRLQSLMTRSHALYQRIARLDEMVAARPGAQVSIGESARPPHSVHDPS